MRGPKVKERLPRPVARRDAENLLTAAAQTKISTQTTPWEQARDAALFTLLYGAGLRIAEALSLKRRDAPLEDTLRITGKGAKTRLVPVIDGGRAMRWTTILTFVRTGRTQTIRLFFSKRGKALSPRMAQRTMAALRVQLGLPDSATPHALRHALCDGAFVRWRRPQIHSGIARAFIACSDATLYKDRHRWPLACLRQGASARLVFNLRMHKGGAQTPSVSLRSTPTPLAGRKGALLPPFMGEAPNEVRRRVFITCLMNPA